MTSVVTFLVGTVVLAVLAGFTALAGRGLTRIWGWSEVGDPPGVSDPTPTSGQQPTTFVVVMPVPVPTPAQARQEPAPTITCTVTDGDTPWTR